LASNAANAWPRLGIWHALELETPTPAFVLGGLRLYFPFPPLGDWHLLEETPGQMNGSEPFLL